MFKKQCMKFGSTALLLFAALITGGCGTTTFYRATPEDTRDLSPAQARKLLRNAMQSEAACSGPRSVNPTSRRLIVTCEKISSNFPEDFRVRAYRYADTPLLTLADSRSTGSIVGPDPGAWRQDFRWYGESRQRDARDFVRAWYVLARAAAVDPAQEAAFERAAQNYRNAQVKPQLPEEAVRYKVQAELAVQQKRFDDAVDLYDQALGIAPWWPQGHYNRGLILGEQQDFQEGIRALQKYLKLEPDASNARAVQLKIYQWESLVPATAK